MNRYIFLVKNNLKKQKGDMITFFILVFLATFITFLCLTFLTGTAKVLEDNKKLINGADILFMVPDNKPAEYKLEELAKGNPYVSRYEASKYLSCAPKYRRKNAADWIEYSFAFASYEEERQIQKLSTDASKCSGNEAIVPMAMSPAFKLGDILEIKIGDNLYELKIAGYCEDNYYASPMNMATYLVYLSEQMYEQIRYENKDTVSSGKLHKILASPLTKKENLSMEDIANEIYLEHARWYDSYKEAHPEADLGGGIGSILPYESMKMGAMILPYLFIAMLLLFSLIMIVIAIVIISFSVKQFILGNMKNTGIMEASGYTVSELVLCLLLQLEFVTFLASFLGVIAGALSQQKAGIIILYLMGLSWHRPVNASLGLICVLFILAAIALVTAFLGREYHKITVLDALRGGVQNHNYKKNHFSYDRTHLPIPITNALKETFGKLGTQIGVALVMAVLSLSTVIGLGFIDTWGTGDVKTFLQLSGIVYGDAICPNADLSVRNTVRDMPECEILFHMTSYAFEYSSGKKANTFTTMAVDDYSLTKGLSIIDGRYPKYENEILLGNSAAGMLNVKTGDVITCKNGDSEASFLVCGLCQTMNNAGQMAYLTFDGAGKVAHLPQVYDTYVILKNEVSFEDFEKALKRIYPDMEVTNVLKLMEATMGSVVMGVKGVSYLITILTALVVAFSESLMIRSRITKEWRNMGISKALGFSTNELILQTVLSNMPAILTGVLLGLLSGSYVGKRSALLMFSILGYSDAPFVISPRSYLLTAFLILGIAAAVSGILSSKIRKLEPVKMITEE